MAHTDHHEGGTHWLRGHRLENRRVVAPPTVEEFDEPTVEWEKWWMEYVTEWGGVREMEVWMPSRIDDQIDDLPHSPIRTYEECENMDDEVEWEQMARARDIGTNRKVQPIIDVDTPVRELHYPTMGRKHAKGGSAPWRTKATRIRVYDLAREVGMPAKDVVNYLRRMGEYVTSPSSTIEAPVARNVRLDLIH